MGDSQACGGYDYLFGEADEITKKIEEYRRNRGGINDSPVDVSPERSPESYISPMIRYQLQNQPTVYPPFNSISSEHHYSQDISHMIYHHQCQNRPTMCNTVHQCQNQPTMCIIHQSSFWKRLISWLMLFFVPRRPRSRPVLVPMPVNPLPRSTSESYESRSVNSVPRSTSDDFADRSNQHSTEEIVGRIQEHNVNIGGGLTQSQCSQLPTIKFHSFIEDKMCTICQLDYVVGEKMTVLPCTHKYHKDCIRRWFQNSRLCSICQEEVVV